MCQIGRLWAFAVYRLYLVILYLLIHVFLELLTSLLAYFVIPFSL
jgi:hypothetical protein